MPVWTLDRKIMQFKHIHFHKDRETMSIPFKCYLTRFTHKLLVNATLRIQVGSASVGVVLTYQLLMILFTYQKFW